MLWNSETRTANNNQACVLFLINISLPWLLGIKRLASTTRLPQEGGFYAFMVPFRVF